MFADADVSHIRAGKINNSDRGEYARLVVRQLRAGKVGLRDNVSSSASVFAVGKSGGALREVWNGSELSAAAALPLRPPHLAGVSALTDLEASPDEPVRVYKRDAKCFFDQLKLPAALQPFFGRPVLLASDILRHTDMGMVELRRHCGDISQLSTYSSLHPVCLTWPMGFSWSSYLAQSTLLHCLTVAGFGNGKLLADDCAPPKDLSLTVSLATDDVMLFARGCSVRARKAVGDIDRAIEGAGIIAHTGKNIDDALNTTVIGVDLCRGMHLTPHAKKMALVVSGLTHFVSTAVRAISPEELQTILGHIAWFALLARPIFSCMHRTYEVARLPEAERHTLDDVAAAELLLVTWMLPWIDADLTRPWQDVLLASDASPAYGFGVSVADASADLLRSFAREATLPNTHARLARDGRYVDEEAAKPRVGRACRLPLAKAAYSTVVSAKAAHQAHAGTLEAGGIQRALRWLLRTTKRHSRRTVLLVDAQAVRGAVAKGRSSAPCLRREVTRIAALQLAGDLLLKLVYVPSEDNPADAPSRGVVRRWRKRRSCTAKSKKRLLQEELDRRSKLNQSRPQRIDKVWRGAKLKINAAATTGPDAEQAAYQRAFRAAGLGDVIAASSASPQ